MLFTDTDSLTYEIRSEDIYEEFFKHKHSFGSSNFPKDSKFFDQANKKFIGKMKDVSEPKIVDEFVGLKSKMHSMKYIDCKESNTVKEVSIATEFNEFKDTLFNQKIMRHRMRRVQPKKQSWKLWNWEILLSCVDDKRSISNNGVDTLAYFHKDLRKMKKSSHEKRRDSHR